MCDKHYKTERMKHVKLGVIISMRDDVRKKFKELSEMGFSACQLSCWNPELYTDENAEIINKAKEERNK